MCNHVFLEITNKLNKCINDSLIVNNSDNEMNEYSIQTNLNKKMKFNNNN